MMRAKLQVNNVDKLSDTQEVITMAPVCGKEPFGANGESEDNTFARYTPSGAVTLTITNPDLIGKFSVGQKLYADFSVAPE